MRRTSQFLAFAFNKYDAEGGWRDFIGIFETLHDAQIAIQKHLLNIQNLAGKGQVVTTADFRVLVEFNGEDQKWIVPDEEPKP